MTVKLYPESLPSNKFPPWVKVRVGLGNIPREGAIFRVPLIAAIKNILAIMRLLVRCVAM